MESTLLLETLRKYSIELKYSLITLILLSMLFLLDKVDAFHGLNHLVSDFMDAMTKLGFIGMFAVALVGNSSLLVQVPYSVPLLSVALKGTTLGNMLFLSFGAGLGAGFGEIISYLIADKVLATNQDLAASRLFLWVQRMVNKHPRITPLLIFVWAASVLPDDTVIIPLAMIKYGIKKIAVPLFMGKMVHNFIVALVFYYFTEASAKRVSTDVRTDLALGILIVFVLVIFYQVEKTKTFMRSNLVAVPAESAERSL